MVGVGDIGGLNSNVTTCNTSGILTGATKTNFNNQTSSVITVTWNDPGF